MDGVDSSSPKSNSSGPLLAAVQKPPPSALGGKKLSPPALGGKKPSSPALGGKKLSSPALGGKKPSSPPLGGKKLSSPALDGKKLSSPALGGKKLSSPALGGKKLSSPALGGKKLSSPALGGKKLSSPALGGKKLSAPALGGKKLSSIRKFGIVWCVAMTFAGGPFLMGAMGPFFTVDALAKHPGAGPAYHTAIGGVYSIMPVAGMIATPLINRELPYFGNKQMIVLCTATQSACALLFAFVNDIQSWRVFLAYCYCIRFLQGVAFAGKSISTLAYMIGMFPENVGFVSGFRVTSLSVGHLTGSLVSGGLYGAGGFRAPFLVSGGLLAVTACVSAIVMVDFDNEQSAAGSDVTAKENHVGILVVLRIPWIWLIVTLMVLSNIAYSSSEALLAPHLKREFNGTAFVTSLVIGLQIVTFAISAPIVGFALDHGLNARAMLAMGLGLIGLGCLLIGPSSSLRLPTDLWLVFVAMLPLGFGYIFLVVPSISEMSRYLELTGVGNALQLRYAIAGIAPFALKFGYALGTLVMSALVAVVTFQAAYTILGYVYFGSVALFLVLSYCNRIAIKRREQDEAVSDPVEDIHQQGEKMELQPLKP